MSSSFPTGLDNLQNPNPNDTTVAVDHAAQHANANDAIEALEAKVGVTNSNDTASLDYKLSHLTKSSVGLPNVDNTSDVGKPLSTTQKTYIDNLVASAITTAAADATAKASAALQAAYPIGSTYVNTTNSANPSTLLGFGTWVNSGPYVLAGYKSGDSVFGTAGALIGDVANTHNHWTGASFDGGGIYLTTTPALPRSRVIDLAHNEPIGRANVGGNTRQDSTYNETISIIQPTRVVYMWERTG